jgi:formylglycine-generating enzyme required for sulfatase activity
VFVYFKIEKRDMVRAPPGSDATVTITGDSAYNSEVFKASRKVTLSAFQIATYETTYELWYNVRQWAIDEAQGENKYTFAYGREGHNGNIGAAPTGDKYEPVTEISWRDAIVWCNAYSEMTGKYPVYYKADGSTILRVSTDADTAVMKGWSGAVPNGYRLPTEAEWEYAARGGGAPGASSPFTDRWAGTNDEGALGTYAWYYSNSGSATHPVGDRTENSLGLHDMSGNVYEWCWDRFYPTISTVEVDNPEGPDTGTARVLRGGSWNDYASICTVAYRLINYAPYIADYSIGFRVVSP